MEVPLLLFFLLWRSSCACEYRVSGRAEASVSGNERLIVNFTDFIAGTSREAMTDSLITPVCSDSNQKKLSQFVCLLKTLAPTSPSTHCSEAGKKK